MNDKDICVTCAEAETCPCRKCWRGNGGIYHCTAYRKKEEPAEAEKQPEKEEADNLVDIVAKDPEVQAVMAEVSDCIFKKAEEAFAIIFNKFVEISEKRAADESEE